MKKLLLLPLLVISSGVWASLDNLEKLNLELKKTKSELNLVYKKAYNKTEAKQQLENAQKQWLRFKELQCGEFVSVDSNYSPAAIEEDLSCQLELYKQRVSFIKNNLQ